jgi:hypothetical protein
MSRLTHDKSFSYNATTGHHIARSDAKKPAVVLCVLLLLTAVMVWREFWLAAGIMVWPILVVFGLWAEWMSSYPPDEVRRAQTEHVGYLNSHRYDHLTYDPFTLKSRRF